jgi:hypothetical protein
MLYSISQVSELLSRLDLHRTKKRLHGRFSVENVPDQVLVKPPIPTIPAGRADQPILEPSAFFGSIEDEDEHFSEVTGILPDQSLTDATYLAAKKQLASELVTESADYFKVGTVFATARDDNVRLWLVARQHPDCCFCIRIRTYQGRGIGHLKDDFDFQARIQDPELRAIQQSLVQKDIDAHAIVYPKRHRSPYRDTAGEPFMRKERLGVELTPGLDHQVVDRMSRACFTRTYRLRYNQRVAKVGCLDPFAVSCVETYIRELLGESSASMARF